MFRDKRNYDLVRFVEAQKRNYDIALAEIKQGQKQSHWMWYIFPQMRGLGGSWMSDYYGIGSLEEAKVYLDHPVLGPRLIEISSALLSLPSNSASEVMGFPDDLKLRSCMTLFSQVDSADPVFEKVLEKYFQGKSDEETLALLREQA